MSKEERGTPNLVIDDDLTLSSNGGSIDQKLDAIVNLIKVMTVRQEKLEQRLSHMEHLRGGSEGYSASGLYRYSEPSKVSKVPEEVSSVPCDKNGRSYPLFVVSEVNPKGGLHSYNEGMRVFISDEKKFAEVTGETRCYVWVMVDGESKARRKIKSKVRKALPN